MIPFPVTKWLSRTAFLAVAVIALPFSGRAAEHPAKPLLWKIEGRGLEKPSYLFGTIHLSTPVIRNLHPSADAAFKASDALYTEVPMGAEDQLRMMPLMMRGDGKTLSESIGPDLTAKLDAELKAINEQLDSQPFQTFKTWAVMAMLPILESQLAGHKALDMLLWERAAAEGKDTLAVETAEGQLGLFEKFTEEEMIILLDGTLRLMKEDRDAGRSGIGDLTKAYESGDTERIQAELDKAFAPMLEGGHKELGGRFIKLLLTDRDESMAATIDKNLRIDPSRVLFFAVGTGHLTGEKNIGGHLAAKGYRVTRVQD